jgi:hypothetical protein
MRYTAVGKTKTTIRNKDSCGDGRQLLFYTRTSKFRLRHYRTYSRIVCIFALQRKIEI